MPSSPPEQQPKWVEINDFRPGIISQAKYGAGPSVSNPVPVPWLGPPGAAQVNGTAGCIALPNGGLAPLPGIEETETSGFTPPGGATAYINGAIIHSLGALDEILYGIEVAAASSRSFRLNCFQDGIGTTDVLDLGPAADTTGQGIQPLTGGPTRVVPADTTLTGGTPYTSLSVVAIRTEYFNGDQIQIGTGTGAIFATVSSSVTPGTTTIPINSITPVNTYPIGTLVLDITAVAQAGQPVVALAYTFIENSGSQVFNWVFPDPANLGSFSLGTLTAAYRAICLCHQNRIIDLQIENYTWTGGGTLFQANETFEYTDPPNSEVMGSQNEVFVAEDPTGVGAYGSIQSGELVLIKHAGGGFLVSGDLDNPIITYLGGVTPTFGVLNDAAQTVEGLVYAAGGNGVWAWQGGSSSGKLSNNLNDDFWELGLPTPIKFSSAAWGEWIAMTNGWVLDSGTGGWWKLTSPGFAPLYYGPTFDGKGVWAVAASFLHSTDPVLAKYHFSVPGNTYTWKSYPLKETLNHICEVQEIALRAQGDGTITITLEGVGGSSNATSPVTVSINSTQPVLYRLAAACQAHDITISISSVGAGGGPAPIVYSVAALFVEGAPVNQLGATL